MTQVVVKDANELDKKIPRDLLMQYQGKWFVLKAGLEYKAMVLYGGGNFGVTTEIIERKPDYVLAKAVFTSRDGIVYSNYGEASHANVSNPQMHKYLLHLAVTRAECRVLRMATACAYASIEEMDLENNGTLPDRPDDLEPATDAQVSAIGSMGATVAKGITRREARQVIVELGRKK